MLIFSWIKLIWIWINRVKYFYVKLDCNKDTRILRTGNKKKILTPRCMYIVHCTVSTVQ